MLVMPVQCVFPSAPSGAGWIASLGAGGTDYEAAGATLSASWAVDRDCEVGEMVVVRVVNRADGIVNGDYSYHSVADSAGNVYSRIFGSGFGANGGVVTLWMSVLTSPLVVGDGDTITAQLTHVGSGARVLAAVADVYDYAPNTQVSSSGSSGSPSNPQTTPGVSGGLAGDLGLGVVAVQTVWNEPFDINNWTPASGIGRRQYVEIEEVSSGRVFCLWSIDRILAAAGDFTTLGSLAGAASYFISRGLLYRE